MPEVELTKVPVLGMTIEKVSTLGLLIPIAINVLSFATETA
jgi:hypothetical protein